MTTYNVSGRVNNRQGKPVEGLTIRAFDQDPNSPNDFLGEGATNVKGVTTFASPRRSGFKLDDKEHNGRYD